MIITTLRVISYDFFQNKNYDFFSDDQWSLTTPLYRINVKIWTFVSEFDFFQRVQPIRISSA